MMNRMLRLILPLALFASCQSYQINPGSERVRVFETEPKNCIFVGEISSVQEDELIGKNTQAEMSLETRVDLRNKAHALGGNILVFMKDKGKSSAVTYSALPDAPKNKATDAAAPAARVEEDTSERKLKTTFLATTFRCPASVVNQ